MTAIVVVVEEALLAATWSGVAPSVVATCSAAFHVRAPLRLLLRLLLVLVLLLRSSRAHASI